MKRLLLVILLSCVSIHMRGQDNSMYYQNEAFDTYLEYMINSKRLKLSHPLNQTITVKQLQEALPNELDPTGLVLSKDLERFSVTDSKLGDAKLGVSGGGNLAVSNIENSYDFSLTPLITYGYKNICAVYSYTADSEYLDDSLYFGTQGKLQNRTFSRSNIAYLKYQNSYLELFLGRMPRNYSLYGNKSLIWSNNPHTFDHFAFSLNNKLLKYTFSMARLEDKYAYDIRDTAAVYDWYKRYFSFHRLELAVSDWLNIALTESILYGGIDQQPLWFYSNPMNVYFISKMNDRKGYEEQKANSLAALEVLFRPIDKVSIYSQFLLDDMDFTKELRDKYPDRIGNHSKISFPNLIDKTQLYLSYTYVSNWTYNSFYTFGNYTFYQRSLGSERNGFQNLTIGMDVFSIPKLIIKAEVLYEKEREQDMEAAFTGVKSDFPIGIAQSTIGMKARLNYIPTPWANLFAEAEISKIDNYNHLANQNKMFLFFKVGCQINGLIKLKNK